MLESRKLSIYFNNTAGISFKVLFLQLLTQASHASTHGGTAMICRKMDRVAKFSWCCIKPWTRHLSGWACSSQLWMPPTLSEAACSAVPAKPFSESSAAFYTPSVVLQYAIIEQSMVIQTTFYIITRTAHLQIPSLLDPSSNTRNIRTQEFVPTTSFSNGRGWVAIAQPH